MESAPDVSDRTDRISDVQIRDTGNRYDGTDGCGLNLHLIQTVKLIELADFNFVFFVRIVVVYDNHVLVDGDSVPRSTFPTPIRPTYSL